MCSSRCAEHSNRTGRNLSAVSTPYPNKQAASLTALCSQQYRRRAPCHRAPKSATRSIPDSSAADRYLDLALHCLPAWTATTCRCFGGSWRVKGRHARSTRRRTRQSCAEGTAHQHVFSASRAALHPRDNEDLGGAVPCATAFRAWCHAAAVGTSAAKLLWTSNPCTGSPAPHPARVS